MTPSLSEAELQAIVDRVLRRTLGASAGRQGRVIALAADHRGFSLKELLKEHLQALGYQPLDCGVFREEPADYPDLAEAVGLRVRRGEAWRGIVIDGAGIGSSIAANKIPGVRAALCYNQAAAVNSVEHNDANVLTLGAMQLGPELARAIVTAWLETRFAGGRHAKRVEKIAALERRYRAGP
jgi:ribose 5-phosphate isomerase B